MTFTRALVSIHRTFIHFNYPDEEVKACASMPDWVRGFSNPVAETRPTKKALFLVKTPKTA